MKVMGRVQMECGVDHLQHALVKKFSANYFKNLLSVLLLDS